MWWAIGIAVICVLVAFCIGIVLGYFAGTGG